MRIAFLFTLVLVAADVAHGQSLSQQLRDEDPARIATAARERGNAVRGAVLYPLQKLGCANCHAPGRSDLLGPDLGKIDPKATDVDIVQSLLRPSLVIKKGYEAVAIRTARGQVLNGRVVERSGERLTLRVSGADHRRTITLSPNEIEEIQPARTSSMPDNLVDQLPNRDAFLDLVKYVYEIRSAGFAGPLALRQRQEIPKRIAGMALLSELSCAACHELPVSTEPPKKGPKLEWLAGRADPNHIRRFIADPLQVKPGSTMPNVLGVLPMQVRESASNELTHYIMSLGEGAFARQSGDAESARRGDQLFHSVGCVACHGPRDNDVSESLGERTVSLGPLHEKYNVSGLTALLEDPHAARPAGRMPNMQLTHFEAVDLAHYLLAAAETDANPPRVFEVDSALAQRGKQRFAQLNCGRCHDIPGDRAALPPLRKLRRLDRGCLSKSAGAWPDFGFSDGQRGLLQSVLNDAATELNASEQLTLRLFSLRCLNCHQRDSLGGVASEHDPYFQTLNPNLGPQSRVPPTLTGVGAKLNRKWLRQVLVSARAIRPYMKTRMPQFGVDSVGDLADRFHQADQIATVEYATFTDQKAMRNAGHELVGDSGLKCVACHTFQQKSGATMAAVDLTEMQERLTKDWFYQYMRAPQRLSPNTIMPTFWPGGRAIRKDILNGDADLQIEALWQYLSDGRQARTPRGLVRQPIELLASDEAVMLRRSYPGIGKRGIGVGYPSELNLAYDAEQMRIAMLWRGKFADPAGVWRGQGHGTVRPLSRDVIRFAKGPDLDDLRKPWVVDEGRPASHQFRGYRLDKKRRPTFRYRYGDLDVEDYVVDVNDSAGAASLRRTLTVKAPAAQKDLAFRAAFGREIVERSEGEFLVDKRLRVRVDKRFSATIRPLADGKQLLIPLRLEAGVSRLELNYHWED